MKQKIFTLIACLVLAACNLPGQQTNSNVQAWFDMPLPDSVFYSSDSCQVIAHGASSGGVAAFEMSINGNAVGKFPNADSKETLATFTDDCPPLQPGKNLIEIRAQDSAGAWSDSSQTTVFLADEERGVPSPLPTETPVSTPTPSPTLTFTPSPTFTPTFTPTPQPQGGVTVERVSINEVYIGGSSCGPTEVTIAARAIAPNGIKVVVLFYRFQTGNSSAEFQSVGMNSMGGDLYERKINMNTLLGGNVPFDQAVFQYQIVVQQNDGDVSIRTPLLSDITVKACGGITLTCGVYMSEASCVEHGCNWVPKPGIVPIYECKNP